MYCIYIYKVYFSCTFNPLYWWITILYSPSEYNAPSSSRDHPMTNYSLPKMPPYSHHQGTSPFPPFYKQNQAILALFHHPFYMRFWVNNYKKRMRFFVLVFFHAFLAKRGAPLGGILHGFQLGRFLFGRKSSVGLATWWWAATWWWSAANRRGRTAANRRVAPTGGNWTTAGGIVTATWWRRASAWWIVAATWYGVTATWWIVASAGWIVASTGGNWTSTRRNVTATWWRRAS